MAATPRVFCAVSAVITEAPKTPSAAKLLRSAWMPAPPDESEPAMVSAMGVVIALPAWISALASGPWLVLGACPNSHCSILGESDSTFGYEQVFSSLEYRSDAASAAECAGLRAERPCLAVYRCTGAG